MSNKLLAFRSNRKMSGVPSFSGKRSCLKRILGYDAGKDYFVKSLLSKRMPTSTSKVALFY